MRKNPFVFGLLAALLMLVSGRARADDIHYYGIPLKPDPPPAIDGRLDEWSTIPNAWVLDTQQHVTYGGNHWKSPADLSAKVWMAWRAEYLYLAADVTDDRIVQAGQGVGMWGGDHIELYLDATPDAEPERITYGNGQIHFGFSPGNFKKTGDPLVDRVPEAVVFAPEGGSTTGILVAAQRTATGYALEAAVPWPLIAKLAKSDTISPHVGTPLGIEVGISDTDGDEPRQEKMMTLLTSTWALNRSRLAAAVLAPANGVAPPVVRGVDAFGALTLPPTAKQEVHFNAPVVPSGKQAILTFRARLDNPIPAGYNGMLRMTLNGTLLDGTRLLNKPPTEHMGDGSSEATATVLGLVVPYAPTFDRADNDPGYGFRDSKASLFDLRVTDLLKAGDNVLDIENNIGTTLKYVLMTGTGRVEFRDPMVPKVKRKAPTGALAVVMPAATNVVSYSLADTATGMALKVGPETFSVVSQFSTPDGAWQTGSNRYFVLRRAIEKRAEAIVVHDTFTNLTDENLPIVQQHRITTSKPFKQVWLGGLSPTTMTSTTSHPDNPTSYGITGNAGVGLMALDDVFRVHVTNYSSDQMVGIADNEFVLAPKATHTAEWVIFPTATPDYYAFLNATRRLGNVNFAIDGSFCFLRADPREPMDKWTDQQFVSFIHFKSAKFVCDNYTWPEYHGIFPHGTAFQTIDWSYLKKQIARIQRVVPESKHLLYFHCFIDVLDGADKKYADARLLRSDGVQTDYGDPFNKIFIPTTTNAFGRDIAKNVDMILAPQPAGFGCNGVYWDEFDYSVGQYHYDDFSKASAGLPWDGVSADIDPTTKKISRLKSSTILLSQPFRVALVKRILAHGPLVANEQPHTRTLSDIHFPHFVETGALSNLAAAQFFSPIALGDSLTERNEVDAYHGMLRALDYGCVYYWYDDMTVMPTHPTLTSYMFPITPIELHEGYIIGKERILTNRSGLFGWGDNSRHEVHVFDDQGREVPGFKAPTIVRNGKTFTELRLAEDWGAAIIRHRDSARS